ncbi:MAG: pyridoxamine 5'-phosphate oxidase family protein [Actinomycetales bacterium]|nr:pyridoxamine 5'-phosphate oxidase family protein [Actinomycetales bacterium]
MSEHGTPVTTVEELEAIVGEPTAAARDKTRPALHPLDAEWIAASPLVFVATSDETGALDVSPKGDPDRVALVLDERTLLLPERPGNRRVDGYRNVLRNPHVGLIFVVPGRGDTLRVNGRATIVRDHPGFAELEVRGHVAPLGLLVEVDEVFHHCSKAFLRSNTWKPETWRPETVVRRAVIAKTLERPDESLAQLDAYYGESYAAKLYG